MCYFDSEYSINCCALVANYTGLSALSITSLGMVASTCTFVPEVIEGLLVVTEANSRVVIEGFHTHSVC